ncbi:MAG: TolC family protein [Gammaproteobacteria bacterium]|nr:TolC family protein [Gammaproteobacteria bacterium]
MRILLLVITLMQGSFVFAQGSVVKTISLEQLIIYVLEKNPELKNFDLESGAIAARIRQAGLTQPYNLTLEAGGFSGSGAYEGGGEQETTISMAKVLELGGKPGLREDLARYEGMLLQSELDAKRLDVLSTAGLAFIQIVEKQENIKILNDKLEIVKKTYGMVKSRVRSGRGSMAEQQRIEAQLADAELELLHTKHSLKAARLQLATMWGEARTDFGEAKAELFLLKPVEDFEVLLTRLEDNPDLVALNTAERLSASRINLALSRRLPDIELSGGVRTFAATGEQSYFFSASIPLGTGSRSRPFRDEARIRSHQAPINYQQQRLALHAALFRVYQELIHARDAVEIFRSRIVPLAQKSLDKYLSGYAQGRYSLFELSESQESLLSARQRLLSSAANYHRYRIEIERLLGSTIATGV